MHMNACTGMIPNCGTNLTEKKRVNLGMHKEANGELEASVNAGGHRRPYQFPKALSCIAEQTEMEALLGFFKFFKLCS